MARSYRGRTPSRWRWPSPTNISADTGRTRDTTGSVGFDRQRRTSSLQPAMSNATSETVSPSLPSHACAFSNPVERHSSEAIRDGDPQAPRSEEHTSELQSQFHLV